MRFSDSKEAPRVLAVVAQGFEELELATYTDLAGWTRLLDGVPSVELVVGGLHPVVRSRHGLRVLPDLPLKEAGRQRWDALFIPGGWPDAGYEEVCDDTVLSLIRETYGQGGTIATSCTGIFAVGEAGLLEGVRATTYVSPGGCSPCVQNRERLSAYGAVVCMEPSVIDQRIHSDVGPAAGMEAALRFFETLVGKDGVARMERELRGATVA